MWYTTSFRRHLIDMHIDDWSDEFLSQFSVEKYIENLKRGNFQNAMIYLQSHVGLCYFPTKVGSMHKAFVGKEDSIRRLIDKCHENDISVTAYYSLNYNTLEHDKHPDWRLRLKNGKSIREGGISVDSQNKKLLFASAMRTRYGLCCPNNPDYREFTYAQIGEMLDYCGKIEGVFFDMPFFNHTCYCSHCQKRWNEEVGGRIPENITIGSEEHKRLILKKSEWMGEFIQSVTNFVKEKTPYVSVEHNFANAIAADSNCACAEEVNLACDFVGGDLYGGIKNHSFACKFYKNITKNMPFDYMFSRCKPSLSAHTLTKTDDEIRSEVFMTIAHNGATLVIDAIDPIGTMDERFYNKIGKILDEAKQFEPYLNGKMVEDIGLYYSLKSKIDAYQDGSNNKNSLISIAETISENHIPFGVTGNFYSLDNYKAIIMPLVWDIDNDNERIIKYVENGGNLYLSGTLNPSLLFTLTGLSVEGTSEENPVYIAPKVSDIFLDFNLKYPLPYNGNAPIVKPTKKVDVLSTLNFPYTKANENKFASIHSNPPATNSNYPALIRTKFGKGTIIWSALPIEEVKIYEYKQIFLNILSLLIPSYSPSFKTNANEDVELTLFENTDHLILHAVSSVELPIAKPLPPFYIQVKTPKEPTSVLSLPSLFPLPFTYKNGYVCFEVTDFRIYKSFMIKK